MQFKEYSAYSWRLLKLTVTSMKKLTMNKWIIGCGGCIIALVGIPIVIIILLYVADATRKVVDPPETNLEDSLVFKEIVERNNQKWRFLFIEGSHLYQRGLLTGKDNKILSYQHGMFVTGRHLTYLSPDKRCALVYSGSLSDKNNDVLLLDIENGEVKLVKVNYEDYTLNCLAEYSPFWLGNEHFVVQVNNFVPREDAEGYYREISKFIRYNIHDLEHGKVLDLKTADPIILPSKDNMSLLIASETQPTYEWPIEIISHDSVSYGDGDDLAYFNELYRKNIRDHTRNISTTRVVGDNVVEGFGPFFDANWNKTYIKINDTIVRCATDLDSFSIRWDEQLSLYYWKEGDQYFYMDEMGHYKKWCRGQYIGKLPTHQSTGQL